MTLALVCEYVVGSVNEKLNPTHMCLVVNGDELPMAIYRVGAVW